MCIAIVATPGAYVDEPRLRACAAANRDGGGYAYVDKDSRKVIIKKGFMKVEDFIESYKQTLDEGHGEENAMLLHFRIATMGAVNRDNCHPFAINEGALIHNGSLFWGDDPSGKDRSDTRIFAEELFPSFTYDRVRDNKKMLEQLVSYNKIAMLFDSGNYVILNESGGMWDEDVWYSNSGYLPRHYSQTDSGWRTRWGRRIDPGEGLIDDPHGILAGGDYGTALDDWE